MVIDPPGMRFRWVALSGLLRNLTPTDYDSVLLLFNKLTLHSFHTPSMCQCGASFRPKVIRSCSRWPHGTNSKGPMRVSFAEEYRSWFAVPIIGFLGRLPSLGNPNSKTTSWEAVRSSAGWCNCPQSHDFAEDRVIQSVVHDSTVQLIVSQDSLATKHDLSILSREFLVDHDSRDVHSSHGLNRLSPLICARRSNPSLIRPNEGSGILFSQYVRKYALVGDRAHDYGLVFSLDHNKEW